ncbi:uncharacterized protein [Panulirus ornatus]|uniref:uncharacterized protein isoform X1 n=1 Tax=Panulirus ornatus TaxID=150431 RepID=UPI003A858783
MAGLSILTNRTFEWLQEKGLCSPATVAALIALGFQRLTTIQLHTLPRLLSESSTFIHARTGSGKTLAFLIPTIERLKAMGFKKSHGVGALIISPTRELAQQIALVLQPLAEAHGFSSQTLTGGTKLKDEDLKEEKVQKILVSATVTPGCTQLAKEIFETKFSFIGVEEKASSTTAQVKQNYISVSTSERTSMLVTVLQTLRKKKVIVFFNSCHSVKFHSQVLSHFKLPVLHCMGQEKQRRRSNIYAKFLALERGILLTTAMAERGWDIPGVHWIIQYDPPHKPEGYIHRVGRTGRGEGHVGRALLFLRPEENHFVEVLKNMNVEIVRLEFQGDLKDVQNKVSSLVAENVEIKQIARLAFKKFVRAYQCHDRKIFNIHTLDINEVSRAFGFMKPPVELGRLK